MANQKPSLIGNVQQIVEEAQELVAALQPKAAQGENLTKKELQVIKKLVQRSEEAMSEASQRAKERRQAEIAELEKLIGTLSSALATPGLSQNARKDLKDRRRRRRAQLLHLQTREALDFGGILTGAQVEEIAEILKRAKQDVATRKKAASFVATLMRVADIGVGIVRKAGGLI